MYSFNELPIIFFTVFILLYFPALFKADHDTTEKGLEFWVINQKVSLAFFLLFLNQKMRQSEGVLVINNLSVDDITFNVRSKPRYTGDVSKRSLVPFSDTINFVSYPSADFNLRVESQRAIWAEILRTLEVTNNLMIDDLCLDGDRDNKVKLLRKLEYNHSRLICHTINNRFWVLLEVLKSKSIMTNSFKILLLHLLSRCNVIQYLLEMMSVLLLWLGYLDSYSRNKFYDGLLVMWYSIEKMSIMISICYIFLFGYRNYDVLEDHDPGYYILGFLVVSFSKFMFYYDELNLFKIPQLYIILLWVNSKLILKSNTGNELFRKEDLTVLLIIIPILSNLKRCFS